MVKGPAATEILDGALATPRAKDGIDRRYRADAELLRHIVAIYRFEIGEMIAAAEKRALENGRKTIRPYDL